MVVRAGRPADHLGGRGRCAQTYEQTSPRIFRDRWVCGLRVRRQHLIVRQAWRVACYRFRATFGRRWGGLFAIVLLIGLLGGLAMGAITAHGARNRPSPLTWHIPMVPTWRSRTRTTD